MQVRAIKTFRGVEGLVRRNDVFEVSDLRGKDLIRAKNVEAYEDKMAAAPQNKMRRDPDPKGMTANNAGGLITFGGEPGDDAGNAPGATAAPDGSQTGEAVSPSSSLADQAPPNVISNASGGRPLRGRRGS